MIFGQMYAKKWGSVLKKYNFFLKCTRILGGPLKKVSFNTKDKTKDF